jgi:hypothetical protein
MVFQFFLEISNFLRLLSFFNSKLKTQNQKLKTVPERGFRSGTEYS